MVRVGLFDIERDGDTVIFTPSVNLSEIDHTEALAKEELDALADPSIKNLIMDFHKTDYFGSSTLAFFIGVWNLVKQRHGSLVFCNLSAHQQEILNITRLDKLWTMCKSREEALNVIRN